MNAPARIASRHTRETVKFWHAREWTLTICRFADGRVGEIFLQSALRDAVSSRATETAVLASVALMHGADVSTLRRALSGWDGPLAAALALIERKSAA